jgi:sigma-B regulation protein RsbU (phosphoserine phosphatase)
VHASLLHRVSSLAGGALAPPLQAGANQALVIVNVAILVVTLAALAAILARRWQSRQALLKRLAELSRLAEAGRALSAAELDLSELAERVYAQAGQVVPTDTFQLGLYEEDRYRLLLWVVDGARRPPAEFRLPPGGEGLVGWVRDQRQSLLVRDFAREAASLPARPSYESPNPPRSAVFAPLVTGDAALGALAVQSRRPNAFSEEDRRLLTILANHAAAALQNANLFEQARRRAVQLELLARVSQRINVLQPIGALYQQVVDLVAETYAGLDVRYYEAQGEALHLRARGAGGPEPAPVRGGAGEGVAEAAGRERRLIVRRELPELPRDGLGAAQAAGTVEIAVPVEIDERLLGVLHACQAEARLFDDGLPGILESLAAQLSLAVLQAQVYAAEQQRAEHLAALAQASRAVASTLELDDLLDEVLDVIDESFGYKAARIFLLHEDKLVFQAGIGEGAIQHSIGGLAYPLDGPGLIARVGRTRQPVVVAEVAEHPDYVPGPGLAGTRSEMAAPLVMGARLMGVLDVQADRPGAFSEGDARTLQTLADTLAVAVRNARLFEYERRRRRLAEIMREVSVALTSTLQLDSVLELILDGLALVVNFDAASILLVNEAGEMVLRAMRGAPGAEAAIGLPLRVRRFGPGEAIPPLLRFAEVDEAHEYHDLISLPEPHACLAAPLAPGGEHLGYLVVDGAGEARFPQGEVELISTFASQAAVAIENARLYTAQREQAWISTALLQVAEATARAAELDDVLATVARLTPMLVGVDRCAILLNAGDRWRMAAYSAGGDGARDNETVAGIAARFPDGLALAGWGRFADLLARPDPLVLEPEDELPEGLRELFIGVVILLPLLAKGEVEGVLMVGQAPGETPFTAHRIRLMGGIANQAALAIESALLTLSQQEEAWVSTALLQVAESVAGQPLDVGLETAIRLTPMLVGIDRLAIYQYDAAVGVFRLRQLAGLDLAGADRAEAVNIHLADLGLGPEDPLFNSEPPWPLLLPQTLAGWFGSPECYIWPLRARGDVLGALVVEARPLLGRRLTILNGIAYQLAMAMENARLAHEVALQQRLERELEVGRDIQATFLPQEFPKAPGWEVAALWRAARQVGGDFYDFIPLQPAETGPRWGMVVADVADKGVPAALFMALSRTLLRTVAINRINPAETLARVNELILSDARSDQFVTMFYGVWEPVTGIFRYAIGGHNPPVWAAADGAVRVLPGRGIALGVVDKAQYEEQQIVLGPGDALVLFTDGLTEAINANNEEFGTARMMEVVRTTRHLPAAAILETLASEAAAHVGAMEQFDDVTIVVLKREAGRERGEISP